ncbi:hypothetical protein [Vibrio mediterranei]|uniref:hypothetical protein n=1 Tax=Vibrio mediterranei TaxID=689 RepID=UPI0022852972|nr:hypothetical protein [Vibrio mediterranei]MCY9851592.1 hypothetical protein [Vibrio mediterranei]
MAILANAALTDKRKMTKIFRRAVNRSKKRRKLNYRKEEAVNHIENKQEPKAIFDSC